MRISRLLFLLLLSSTFFVTSCGDDDDLDPNEALNNRLEGEWDVTSWTIDGVETIPALINSFTMEFDKEDPNGGETDWTIIDRDGDTQRFRGDYEIENAGTEIDIDGDELDIEIDGDELELEGTFDGDNWRIRADRD